MLLIGFFRNFNLIKFDRCMWSIIWTYFLRENNFISLFGRIWMKLHFPLISPIAYLFKVIVKFDCCFMYVINLWKKGGVSSANILHNEFILSGRSFMYIEKESGPKNNLCGSPDIIFLHSHVWLFRATLCCWFSR